MHFSRAELPGTSAALSNVEWGYCILFSLVSLFSSSPHSYAHVSFPFTHLFQQTKHNEDKNLHASLQRIEPRLLGRPTQRPVTVVCKPTRRNSRAATTANTTTTTTHYYYCNNNNNNNNNNAKLLLRLINHHARASHWMEVTLHASLTSARHGGLHAPVVFILGNHRIRDWMGSNASRDALKNCKISQHLSGSEPHFSVLQPKA